jgi:predicted alpha/beta-hydrolase family hydrolase
MASAEPVDADGVRGFLHRTAGGGDRFAVLTHGAGGDCRTPLLVALAEALCGAGFQVLRCDLPFRQRRAKGPPSPSSAAADREGLRQAVAAMRRRGARRIVLGGQSYGGRQATMLAAETPEIADALLLTSYPLHPPGKPERLRTEHFPRLRLPAVFVQGAADPFGSPEELRAALAAVPVPPAIVAVPGAGHDLKRGRFDLAPVLAAVSRHQV